jgi:hypothetical protein
MSDHIQAPASDAELLDLYNKLREPNRDHSTPPVDAPDHIKKFSPEEAKIASGYAVRVAKASTFEQFKEFAATGVSPVPVKMSPAEMELLMGGGPIATWVKAAGWVAGAVCAASCADPC